jgi:hypothetical protein
MLSDDAGLHSRDIANKKRTLNFLILSSLKLQVTLLFRYLDVEHPLQKLKSMGLQRKKLKVVSIQSVSTKSNLFKKFVAKFHNFRNFYFFSEKEKRKRKIGLNKPHLDLGTS